MSTLRSAQFQHDLLKTIADYGGEAADFAVTSSIDMLLDGPAFTVALKMTDMDTSEPLYADLQTYARKFNMQPVLELLMTLPDGFPDVPPIVRLLHPVLIPGTGHVLNGNFVLPQLFAEGWSADTTLQSVLEAIKISLINHGARIDTTSYAFYNYQAFKASSQRLRARHNADWEHPKPFSKKYEVYSSRFALEVMGLELPAGFEFGNKILMPPVSLQEMSAVSVRRPAVDVHADESAMVFELVSAWRFPTFVGVHGFLCPHPNIIIVPDQVMSNMFILDGTEVTLTRVQLPPLESVVVQPHTVNFIASEAFTDKAPKEFLEAAFLRYSCLQAGEVIACDVAVEAGPSASFTFNVVAVKPEGFPAAALWAGFSSHVTIEFLPAMDEFPVPQQRKMAPSAGLGNSVGVLAPDLAAQIFGEVPHSTGAPTPAPVPPQPVALSPSGTVSRLSTSPYQAPPVPFAAGSSAPTVQGRGGGVQAGALGVEPATTEGKHDEDMPAAVDPAERRRRAAEAARRRAMAPTDD